MEERILILGGGFGGLELAILSDELGDDAGVTSIDAAEAFVFGYSKLDVMFGRAEPGSVDCPTRASRSRGSDSCARRSRHRSGDAREDRRARWFGS